MKILFRYMLVLALVFSLVAVPAVATEQSDGGENAGSFGLEGQYGMLGSHKLIINAQSVFLYELKSETLMYAWNADERLTPASFVKLMNTLLVVENAELTETVTVERGTLNTVPSDARISKLKPGETFTVEDLLCFMLVDSGNDAAAILADYVGGNQEAFVGMMNRRAQELGCTNTNFVNVHGLYHENQYMSARDTARILAYAMDNPVFRDIFTRQYHTVPATSQSPERQLATDNFLLSEDVLEIYYDSRVLASRTGVDQVGHRCIASVAADNGMEYVVVVMGCASEYEKDGYTTKSYGGYSETKKLLEAGFDDYKTAQILYDGQIMRQVDIYDGACQLSMGVHEGAVSVLPESVDLEDLEYVYEDVPGALTAPVAKGDHVATLRVMLQGSCLAQRNVYAMNSVSAASAKELVVQRGVGEEASSGGVFWTVILVLLGICAVVALFFYISRKRDFRAVNKRRRRQQADRRRAR